MTTLSLSDNQDPIREAVDAGLLSGAVTMVWQRGEVLQVNEFGYRDVEARQPMTARHRLPDRVDEQARHRRRRDDPARRGQAGARRPGHAWLPEFEDMRVLEDPGGPLDATSPARRPITVDDLITHRSGLAYGFSVVPPLNRAYGKLSFRQDQDRWLAELAALPLAHQPGERLTYSHATDVLGILLSRIEGKPFPDVLSERIFEPLGMTDTGFAVGHGGPPARGHDVHARRERSAAPRRDGAAAGRAAAFCLGGGGLWSTVDDYLQFVRMLLADGEVDGARVLSAESVRLMRTDRLTDEQRAIRSSVCRTGWVAGSGWGCRWSPTRSNPGRCSAPAGSARSDGPAPTARGGRPTRRST